MPGTIGERGDTVLRRPWPGTTWRALPLAQTSDALQLDVHRRALGDGLIDHAIALGELQKLVELVLRRVRLDVEAQPDLAEADRRLLVDTEGAAEVEIALGRHGSRLE